MVKVRVVASRVLILAACSWLVAAGVAAGAERPMMCKYAAVSSPADKGALKAADQCLTQAQSNGDKALAYHLKARAMLWAGSTDWPTIIDAANKALQLNPKDDYPYLVRGQANLRAGKIDDAFKDLKRAAESKKIEDLGDHWARLEWVAAQIAKGDWTAANKEAQNALTAMPDHAPLWALAFVTASRTGDKTGASALLSKYMASPTTGYGKYNVDIFIGRITPDEAIVRAMSATGEDTRGTLCVTNFFAGEFYMLRGNPVAARRHFEAAVATGGVAYPEYAMAQAELRRL